MDLEFTIKSSLKVRTVRAQGDSRRQTLTRMVLGYDSSVTYSADRVTGSYMPIKTEARECSDSPFGYSPGSPDLGIYSSGSPLSGFCLGASDIHDSKMSAMKKLFVGDLDSDSLTSWTTKHPQNWTKAEVLDWVYYVVEQEKLDGARVKGEAYRNFTGSRLIEMGSEDFIAADPVYGLKMYQTFRSLVNNVIIEEPRRAPFPSTLDTFNQDNYYHVEHLAREICNGVLGGGHAGSALSGSAGPQGRTVPGNGVQLGDSNPHISAQPSFPPWRPSERAKLNSATPGLPSGQGGFEAVGRGKDSYSEGKNTSGGHDSSDDLVVYDMGGDVKVGLQGLGTYPIDHDFSLSLSSVTSSLNQAFTAPLSPMPNSSLPQFEAIEPPQRPPTANTGSVTPLTPLTPPLSNRGPLSSASSSCADPASPFFLPGATSSRFSSLSSPSSMEVFSPPANPGHLKRPQSITSTPAGAAFKHSFSSCAKRPSLASPSSSSALTYTITPGGQSLASSGSACKDIRQAKSPLSPSSSSSSILSSSSSCPPSYHFQKTMTATLCRQNKAGVGPLSQQRHSQTFSSSWTFSSSSSSSPSPLPLSSLPDQQQGTQFMSPRPSSSSSPSVWHNNPSSTDAEDSVPTFMPSRTNQAQAGGSVYDGPLDEDDLAIDFDPNVASGGNRRRPRQRNRNNSAKTGNHLWEFVRDLLRDPKFNPRLLKWEDKENGVFRFVQSEQVARLWGEKKNNPLMTYEKLSRAMRFCRKTGHFNAVPRTGKFPKKLCFMFGEKAHGWKD